MSQWLVLQTYRGNAFRIEEAINAIGVQAYMPKSILKRRDPRDRSRILDVRKALLPGYCFTSERFNLNALVPSLLDLSRTGNHRPHTVDCRVNWLTLNDKPLTMTPEAMQKLYEAERAEQNKWRPMIEDIAHALQECSRGVKPRRFVKLSEWQGVAA